MDSTAPHHGCRLELNTFTLPQFDEVSDLYLILYLAMDSRTTHWS